MGKAASNDPCGVQVLLDVMTNAQMQTGRERDKANAACDRQLQENLDNKFAGADDLAMTSNAGTKGSDIKAENKKVMRHKRRHAERALSPSRL